MAMANRRIPEADGLAALASWQADASATPRETLATAVRYTLEQLAAIAPGRSVEVRVPPFAAVQVIEGQSHRRGTPPAVIETDPATWLALATGTQTWADAVAAGTVDASGSRADLAALLPLVLDRGP
jgi:hypothetical protein